jgi:hypothetical protein
MSSVSKTREKVWCDHVINGVVENTTEETRMVYTDLAGHRHVRSYWIGGGTTKHPLDAANHYRIEARRVAIMSGADLFKSLALKSNSGG